jgi:protocatechuate 3,4-dioxygenase beta subunit
MPFPSSAPPPEPEAPPRLRRWLGIGTALAAVVGFGIYAGSASPPAAAAPPAPFAALPVAQADEAKTTTPASATLERATPGPERRPPVPAIEPAAQGLRGRVLDDRQQPIEGAAIHLLESVGNDPLAIPVLQQQRQAFGPVATVDSGADGSFAIGLGVAQEDKVYELYVQAQGLAVARRGGLRLVPNQWYDVGSIELARGATLRGRVTVAGRPDIPVPGATIAVEVGGAFVDAALRALPDAGPGLIATANAYGEYELPHVPSRGVVQASAVGRGFARLLRTNVELAADGPTVLDFALTPGHVLAGVVVDERGSPVAGAVVEAWSAQPQRPLSVRAADDGRFEILGVGSGAHRIHVRAAGHHPHDEHAVEPGRVDLQIVLQRQNRLRVRAETPSGATLRSYRLAVRRWFPEAPEQLAAAPEVPERRVRLDGFTDAAEIEGLPAGWFCVQIDAEGWARTFSAPIDNTGRGARDLAVVVAVTPGAALHGRVTDARGQPLAAADVHLEPAGHAVDNPFVRMFAGAFPHRATVGHTRTAADGSFSFERLSFASYQLRIEHPEACREIVPIPDLDRVEHRTLPPIALHDGAIVRGRIRNPPPGQVKVVLTSLPAAAAAAAAIRVEAIADADGTYCLPRRLPAGEYELRAAGLGTAEPEAQIFQHLAQMKRSATRLVIAAGQRLAEHDLDLSTDR